MNAPRPLPIAAIHVALFVGFLGGCASAGPAIPGEGGRGSANLLTAEQIARYPTTATVEEILAQHVPGIQIQRRIDGRISLQIGRFSSTRGVGEPLYVIDGVPRQNHSGSIGINPRDIERIEVLKDSATAGFGFRGANGVVLITTKQAR